MQTQMQSQISQNVANTVQLMDSKEAQLQALLNTNPNGLAQMLQSQSNQLVEVSVKDQLKQMANQHDDIIATDLSAFTENEKEQILSKSQSITDYIMQYDPEKHGTMYLHNIVLASDAQSDKIMSTMNGKADILTKTLSDLSSSPRHAEHNEAMMVITEILNENQDASNLAFKLKKLFKHIPIVGKMLNQHAIPLLEEYLNGRKTLEQILTEIQRILTRTESEFLQDINRLINVRDQLQITKRELRKQSAILEQTIALVKNKMATLPIETQQAITEMVLTPLSSQLSINTQKIGVSSQYVIAVETGVDGNKILMTTSKETREVCIYAMRLSFTLDSTLQLQEKGIKQQQGIRKATDILLKNNAKRLKQNAKDIHALGTSSSLNPDTYRITSQQVIEAAEQLANTKREIFENNMRIHKEILEIDQELNKFSHQTKQKIVTNGLNGITQQDNQTTTPQENNILAQLFS